jgi:hypothetical protein
MSFTKFEENVMVEKNVDVNNNVFVIFKKCFLINGKRKIIKSLNQIMEENNMYIITGKFDNNKLFKFTFDNKNIAKLLHDELQSKILFTDPIIPIENYDELNGEIDESDEVYFAREQEANDAEKIYLTEFEENVILGNFYDMKKNVFVILNNCFLINGKKYKSIKLLCPITEINNTYIITGKFDNNESFIFSFDDEKIAKLLYEEIQIKLIFNDPIINEDYLSETSETDVELYDLDTLNYLDDLKNMYKDLDENNDNLSKSNDSIESSDFEFSFESKKDEKNAKIIVKTNKFFEEKIKFE